MTEKLSPEQVAKAFHDTYERLAPAFGYETRKASAKPWDEVPEVNRNLMTAVVIALAESGVISFGPTDNMDELRRLREAEGDFGARMRTWRSDYDKIAGEGGEADDRPER